MELGMGVALADQQNGQIRTKSDTCPHTAEQAVSLYPRDLIASLSLKLERKILGFNRIRDISPLIMEALGGLFILWVLVWVVYAILLFCIPFILYGPLISLLK